MLKMKSKMERASVETRKDPQKWKEFCGNQYAKILQNFQEKIVPKTYGISQRKSEIEENDSDDDDEQEEADDEREEKIPKSQGRKVKGGQNSSFHYQRDWKKEITVAHTVFCG
ncbi:hypothetical protein ISN44_As12g006190 [Arabidopsis suecica]|uniref:Uncharacterized protein n=1 Tax=Arabidopsis suecica TaxID=45249 RepID=A0A8T1YGC7_ARASU|nr:hypothetical protein ISN44_As12g006190 [Arabidopsis suecica]